MAVDGNFPIVGEGSPETDNKDYFNSKADTIFCEDSKVRPVVPVCVSVRFTETYIDLFGVFYRIISGLCSSPKSNINRKIRTVGREVNILSCSESHINNNFLTCVYGFLSDNKGFICSDYI